MLEVAVYHQKSYTKEEQEEFSKKDLIESAPLETVAGSLKYLIRNQIISKAKLVGIENYIFGKPLGLVYVSNFDKSTPQPCYESKTSSGSKKYKILSNLGKVALISSIQSMQRAKICAAMAAQIETSFVKYIARMRYLHSVVNFY